MTITSVKRIPGPGMIYLKACWSELIVCDRLDRSISLVVSSPEIQLFHVNVLTVLRAGLELGQTYFSGTVIRLVGL